MWPHLSRYSGIAFLLLAVNLSARGDSPAQPFSYAKASADGRYVFVMIADQERTDDWIKEFADKIREVRATYPKSGLYRNDGSRLPVWTVDWYAHNVYVASDGVHLVRMGPWPSTSDQEAVSFFAKGQLLRSHKISELVDLPFLMPHSISHFMWLADASLDENQPHFLLSTEHKESFAFDLTTGEIISSFRLPRWIAFGIGLLFVVVIWRRRRRHRQNLPIEALSS